MPTMAQPKGKSHRLGVGKPPHLSARPSPGKGAGSRRVRKAAAARVGRLWSAVDAAYGRGGGAIVQLGGPASHHAGKADGKCGRCERGLRRQVRTMFLWGLYLYYAETDWSAERPDAGTADPREPGAPIRVQKRHEEDAQVRFHPWKWTGWLAQHNTPSLPRSRP